VKSTSGGDSKKDRVSGLAAIYTVSGLLAFLNIYEFIYLNSIIIFKMVYDSYDFELVTDFQRFYELVYEIIFSR
jgi:hypothetical protein